MNRRPSNPRMDVVTKGINSPQRNTEEEEPKDETEQLAREVGGKPRGKICLLVPLREEELQ